MKKLITIFLCFIFFTIFSCSHLIENNKSSLQFTLGKENTRQISRSLLANRAITNDTQLEVVSELLGHASQKDIKNTSLVNLANLTFKFNDVPLGKEYKVSIKIFYNDILIYQGLSDKILLTEVNPDFSLNLKMAKKLSKINWNFNGGNISPDNPDFAPDKMPGEYFIDSVISLPGMEKADREFTGWYLNPEFTGDAVTELGVNNFLGDVNLYACWKNNSPSPVKDLKFTADNGKITLNWTNPSESDVVKILVTKDGAVNEIQGNTTNSKLFEGLYNGKTYSFEVKAVDNEGLESSPVKLEVPLYLITSSPKKLTDYKSPYAPDSGVWNYVEFGDWPQDLKSADVSVSTLVDGSTTRYYGSDGYFYEKSGNDYYKVLPIKWRVLTEHYIDFSGTDQEKLLFSEIEVECMPTGAQNYGQSSVRTFLNGDFFTKAFSQENKNLIKEVSLDNSETSTIGTGDTFTSNTNIFSSTKDKVFLLSTKEVSDSAYGFKSTGEEDVSRKRPQSGYSGKTQGAGSWWLRSSIYTAGDGARSVDSSNGVLGQYQVTNHSLAVVPALCLPANAF